jgi:cytochrome c peroxidase
MTRSLRYTLAAGLLGGFIVGCHQASPRETLPAPQDVLEGLSIRGLGPAPAVPSNRHADDPAAAALGQRVFFDEGFSRTGKVSCATCHEPDRAFTDDLPLAKGVGTTARRTMPLLGAAWSPWQFWDGRKDSLWSQALGPLENPVEHGGTRTAYVRRVATVYRSAYEAVFGPLPGQGVIDGLPASAGPVDDPADRSRWEAMSVADRDTVTGIFANVGKAIEAYERRLVPGASRFDRYVDAVVQGDYTKAQSTLTPEERAGLALFTGKAKCIDCHNGPLFTNNEFHNTGVPARPELPADTGRADGVKLALADEFNSGSRWSDTPGKPAAALRFARRDDHRDERAFKPPSLRNVAERPPYMHAGQLPDLRAVIDHYDRAPEAPAGHSELEPLHLSAVEKSQLEAFLHTLSGPSAADPRWLQAPDMLPSH